MLSSRSELEDRHQLFARTQFVQGPLGERHFQDVLREVNGLKRAGETLKLPDQNEADALAKLWSVYQALLARREREASIVSPAEVAQSNQFRSDRREQNDFATVRALLADAKNRIPNWPLFVEFAGLESDDLTAPVQFWGNAERARAERVTRAMGWIRNATPEQWARLPERMAARRAEEAAREQIERSKRIEHELAELKAQLAAVKSQSAAREIVEDMDDIVLDMRKVYQTVEKERNS